jgi:hypothetical protein
MRNLRTSHTGFTVRRTLPLLALFACFSTAALGAQDITGSVHNRTRGQASAGDEAILLRMDQGMQEEAHTMTGPQGAFTLTLQFPDKPHVVRVMHQGVNYDQRASPGDVISIDVFDAAPKVAGITGSIEIIRPGTNGNKLHVSDLCEIRNESQPPLTQAGERTFEVYLPADAKIDSVLAAGPGKNAVMISAALVPGEPGHLVVNFPLRPGATKFAFNYDLPYDGHAAFQNKRAYPVQQLAVMIPPGMKFLSTSPAFESLATGNTDYQVHAANRLQAGQGPGFEVYGTGALPPLGDQSRSQAQSQPPAFLNPAASARGRLVLRSLAHFDSRMEQPPTTSESLVLGGLTAVLLAACAFLVWRARKTRAKYGTNAAVSRQTNHFRTP